MNGSTPVSHRAFAALAYVMPLTSALAASNPFLTFLGEQSPAALNFFFLLLWPLTPFILIESNQFLGLAIFVALFVFVVRNTNISRFIRFNVLQAILISFVISVGLLIIGTLGPLSGGILGETLQNVLFLGGTAIVVYGIAKSVMGQKADIPTISEAIDMQMPF